MVIVKTKFEVEMEVVGVDMNFERRKQLIVAAVLKKRK